MIGFAEYKTKTGGFEVIGRKDTATESIAGSRYSVVQKKMAPGQKIQAEPGVMMYKHPDVKMSVKFAGWRAFSGEGLAKTMFENKGEGDGYIGLTPNFPFAVVMTVDPAQ